MGSACSTADTITPEEKRKQPIESKENKSTISNGSAAKGGISSEDNSKSDKSSGPTRVKHVCIPDDRKLPAIEKLEDGIRPLIYGILQTENGQKIKVLKRHIRIYHSACLTDSIHERQMLFTQVYPKLRLLCAEQGFDLNVVDLHCGLKTEQLNDHSLRNACQKHMASCFERAAVPAFVLFLNDKCGTAVCPPAIPAADFEAIQSGVGNEADMNLLKRWYLRDENAKPPQYVLQPVTTHIQNYNDSIQDAETGEWIGVVERIVLILRHAMPVDLQDVYLTSVLEDEIENFVMKPGVNNPVVYINRSFVTQPQNPQQPQARDYFDLLSNQLDSKAKSKVDSLASKLDSRCTEKLQMSLSWCDETGFSPRSNPEHVKYLDSLCEQYYGKMKVLLESSMKQVLVQAENFRQKDVSSNLHEELVNLFKHIFIKNSFKFFGGREGMLKKIESYIASGHTGQSDTAVRPLLLTGSHGSGASGICILTNGIVHTVPGWEGSVCVLRILKLSTRARTVETMLHCILEQVCLAYDLPISYATRSLKEQQKLFYNILEKVTAKNPLIIIMDGLQDLIPTPGGQVEWIPAELPPNVRIIVTATEDGLQKMKLPSSTHSLSIPPFTKEEGEFLLNRILELHSRTLTPSQRGEVISAIERCPSPIYAVTLSAMASHWHSYTSDMQNRIKGSTEEQFGLLLDEMDEKYGVDCVKQILGYFSCAKTGLTDNELIDLVLCDKVIMNKLDGDAFAARSVWNRLCIDIEYLLMYRMVYGLITFQWKHSVFADCVMKRYFPKAEDIQAVHRLLMQYYEGNLKLNVSLGSTIPQPIKFGNTFNLRKLTELPYQMVKSGCVEKVKTQCLLNLEFLMAKMESVGVDGVIEDVAMAVQVNPNDQELQQLYQLLQMSAFALSLDPSRLWMQFTSRVGKASLCPPIQQLCDESKSVIHDEGWFETKSPVSHVLDQMPSDDKVGQALVTGVFKLKTDPAHVVTVSTSQKKVQVWNLTSGKAVRTLINIPQPRNVRMVDDYRAVVLCNRELKVFDLNQGTLLSELKGVLNVERPYFEIMDENHAVTLSRNRMYVNIMELETGSQESTFKVGEDRFLDSLFVSADGQMCVCGDEVQKPFPLLVWDLPNKKLIHDMRIPNHEFLTSMAAISHDGQYVVSVCKEVDDPAPNFLTIYDLQSGQMYKKWTPEVSTCAVAISSAGHCVVNCLETGTLMVWDLVAGGLRHELSGHRQGVDRILISDSGTRCVSYSTNNIDQTVKLWDLTKGACLASFTSDVPLTSCELSMDGNAVILGLEGREDIVVLQLCLKEGGLQMITDGSYGDDSLKDKEFDPMAK